MTKNENNLSLSRIISADANIKLHEPVIEMRYNGSFDGGPIKSEGKRMSYLIQIVYAANNISTIIMRHRPGPPIGFRDSALLHAKSQFSW